MKKLPWIILLILLTLLASGCLGGAAPADPEEEVAVVTFTSTPLVDMDALAALTFTATDAPTETLTPVPSATPTLPEATATQSEPTFTPSPEVTATQTAELQAADATTSPTVEGEAANEPEVVNAEIPEGGRFFIIQQGAPIGMPNWAHQDLGCNWLGVAGQVFDLEGNPVLDLVVEVGGTLDGQPLLGLSLTGVATAYGPGGYEIQLADHVVASVGDVWVLVKNDAGDALSGNTFVETFADCEENLLLLNFVEVEEIPDSNQVFFPLIIHQDSD